jgi:hypothetical protein
MNASSLPLQPCQKKARNNNNNNDHHGSSSENPPLNHGQQQPPPQYQRCQFCQGSGLIERQQQSPPQATRDDDEPQKVQVQGQSQGRDAQKYPTVAIIGGGIGGLALGLACWHRNIPFQIYERDTSFLERKQGYGLTLQQASKALKGFGFLGPRTNQTKPNSNMNTNKASTTKNDSTTTSGTTATTTNEDDEDETTNILKGGITSTRHVVHTPNGDLVGEWGMRKWRQEKANTKTTKDDSNDESMITHNDKQTTTTPTTTTIDDVLGQASKHSYCTPSTPWSTFPRHFRIKWNGIIAWYPCKRRRQMWN